MAAVYTKEKGVHLQEVPVPQIQKETDAIVRVTYSTICGTDIHINNGVYPVEDGLIIGHEFVGEVVETGSAVKKFKAGDQIAANCITTCGECYYCKHGYTNHCEGYLDTKLMVVRQNIYVFLMQIMDYLKSMKVLIQEKCFL